MCRILAVRAERPADVAGWLDAFRVACRASREYQGHGWGVAWREGGEWRRHRSLTPIWDDVFAPPPTTLALVHARSAFRDEGIVVENNMPFLDRRLAFAFNGELRGVRLRVPGDTGAARLHTLLERFAATDDPVASLQRLDEVIRARTDYVRALNVVASDGTDLFALCRYAEDPEYFTLRTASIPEGAIVCSEAIATDSVQPAWTPLADGEARRIEGRVACCS